MKEHDPFGAEPFAVEESAPALPPKKPPPPRPAPPKNIPARPPPPSFSSKFDLSMKSSFGGVQFFLLILQRNLLRQLAYRHLLLINFLRMLSEVGAVVLPTFRNSTISL